MSRYIPMPAYPDAMPVDISFVFADEKPAGKRGFVRADGEDLRFEDGTVAKFWGVNFNGGACFPSHEYSPKVARRLAQAGCNIVRFHQLDAEWDTPNIFSFSKGKRVTTTRVLDPKSLDALDYLVHCLKEEGIYCYLDMTTYRKFKEGDDVPFYEELSDNARPWSNCNARLIELQKEFCTQIWNHVNPYTGLAYKDDPVFVLSEISNENDLFTNSNAANRFNINSKYYENDFRQQFKAWLEENGIDYDWENCDLFTGDDPMIQFKIWRTRAYYEEVRDHMRAIGVKIPITGTNWSHTAGLCKAHDTMDFTDSHHYFYDWKWGNTERVCAHRNITAVPTAFPNLPKMRLPGKPYFISEWDMPWPNAFRAEGSIYYAAVAALQNWSGLTIHTYAYCTRLDEMKVLGRELSSPVGGVPYREGIFSVWNDPAKFGLFYHAALMLRRSDITPATKKVAVNAKELGKTVTTAYQGGLEQYYMTNTFDNVLPEGYDELVQEEDKIPHATPGIIMSDNGQMWRDLKRQIGVIDTERTKVFYGMLGKGGAAASTKVRKPVEIHANGMTIDSYTDFGVIALSSLTNDPIEKSDNMLLSAIGRARNTGAQFDGDKMIDVGHAPILAEVINADIKLKTDIGDKLRVWGVNAEGFYAGRVPTTYEDGILSFEIGDELNPACYYLIVKE